MMANDRKVFEGNSYFESFIVVEKGTKNVTIHAYDVSDGISVNLAKEELKNLIDYLQEVYHEMP